jgi:hypothetical protein
MMINTLSLAFLAACGTDPEPKPANRPPSIEIRSHTVGAELDEGVPVEFQASASDPEDAAGDLLVSWYVDGESACGPDDPDDDGVSVCTITLWEGDSVVSVLVVDTGGLETGAEVSVGVIPNEPPVASILSPSAEGVYYSDQLIRFHASASDAEDAPSDLRAQWSSDADGPLQVGSIADENGEFEGYGYLGEGSHELGLVVTDSVGKTASASASIQVGGPNQSPECGITAPEEGVAAIHGEALRLEAFTTDPDVSSELLSVEWYSDRDGSLGESQPSADGVAVLEHPGLSKTGHTITLSVSDEVGATCSDSMFLTVGSPPTAAISEPLDGEVYTSGEGVSFSATVSDGEDSPGSLDIVWTSDLDGILSEQGASSAGLLHFTSFTLSAGQHSITLSATDSTGLSAADSISFQVNTPPPAPSVSISPDPATTQDTLAATVSSSGDADGDALSYTYAWSVDGVAASYTGDTVPASATTKNEVWTVLSYASDGYADGPSSEASITVSNTPPEIQYIAVSPGAPSNTDLLDCTATAWDPDETPSLSYTWSNATTGQYIGTGPSVQLVPSDAATGDVIECACTASDGDFAYTAATASVTISNAAPLIEVSISPSEIYNDTLVECVADVTDTEGDSVTLSYEWQNLTTGDPIGASAQLQLDPSFISPYDTIFCEATATDGVSADSATAEASVGTYNTPPEVEIDSLEGDGADPDVVRTDDLLTVSVDGDDDDGQDVLFTYTWYVDGEAVAEEGPVADTTSTLDGAIHFEKGQSVEVEVLPTDGDDPGESVLSESVTVANSAPSAPVVAFEPAEPADDEDMVCTAADSVDPDSADTVSYSYSWTQDGADRSDLDGLDTVPASELETGEEWTCTAEASDGEDEESASVSAVIQIGWEGPAVFTNCGQEGREGPSQSQCDSEYAGTVLEGGVSVSGGIQQWTVPVTATYLIEAAGARGGNPYDDSSRYGRGARLSSEYELTAGEVIYILVGQMGSQSSGGSSYNSSGGGGTFVYFSAGDDLPLVVAGGGGGGSYGTSTYSQMDASLGETGQSGVNSGGSTGGSGGSDGLGGTGSYQYVAGAGAGWVGDGGGGNSSCGYSVTGGYAPRNGGFGGYGGNADYGGSNYPGGFGGGGGGTGACSSSGAGAGGGFSGGGVGEDCCSSQGGGGGSYSETTVLSSSVDSESHGQVVISLSD